LQIIQELCDLISDGKLFIQAISKCKYLKVINPDETSELNICIEINTIGYRGQCKYSI
jgi:hypothetical protein